MLRELLRKERCRQAVTAKSLSLQLGMDHSYISRVERGYRTIDVVEFLDIAAALKIDPVLLFRQYIEALEGRTTGSG